MSRAINGYLNKNMQKKLYTAIVITTLLSTSLPLSALALVTNSPGTGSNLNTEQSQSTDANNTVTPASSVGSQTNTQNSGVNTNTLDLGSSNFSGTDYSGNLTQTGLLGGTAPSALDQVGSGSLNGSLDLSGLPQASAGSQAAGGTTGTGGGGNAGAAGKAGTNIGSCAISGAIAHAVSSAVSSLTSSLTSSIGEKTVPINTTQDPQTTASTKAHTGNITIGGLDLGISWDGLAYCAGNAVIQYVGDQMMNMINKGFNGNPAFVKNPQQFFSDISASQANQFISTLANSAIAPPLQNTIAKNLIGGYNSNFTGSQPHTWNSSQTQSYNSFISGSPSGFSLSSLFNISQNPSNNFYGSQMMAQNQLQNQIAQKIGLQQQQLQWNQGYLSTQNCQTVNGKQVCNVTTPGTNISAAGKNAQNLPNLRLAAQNKFDQVLSMLIQQLIKTGLSELMQPSTGGGSSGGGGGNSSSSQNNNPAGVPSGFNYQGQIGSSTSTLEYFSNKSGSVGYIYDETTGVGFSTTTDVIYFDPSNNQAYSSSNNKTVNDTTLQATSTQSLLQAIQESLSNAIQNAIIRAASSTASTTSQ